ncbi:MAG: SLBB domain-containing protein [Alphaproteobacteria bacterium]|nr:SLBB domain-containing protein [Alphaproteobacteria bacterium]
MCIRSRFLAPYMVAALLLPLGPAAAADDLSRFYAPWLGQQAALEPDKADKPRPVAQKNTAKTAPLMTPETTRAVMVALGHDAPRVLSPLEESYSRRVVDEVQQFGYDLFAGAAPQGHAIESTPDYRAALPMGAVQDDFILNSGDRLSVTFRGQRSDSKIVAIDSNGQLLVDDLPPVSAAGRTIKQVRDALQSQVMALHNTEIYLALESVQQAGVLIVGNVKNPGRKNLTVFNSVLDALIAAGGVERTGSLRQIKLVRNGRSTLIDLYSLLIYGSENLDITLRDGDRLIVPPIGPTVAVAGGVKRPGIYEIMPALRGNLHKPQTASEFLSLQDMLELAGGPLSPGQNRFMRFGLTGDGREVVDDITDPHRPVFTDGAILMVAPSDDMRAGTVELAGHTRRPGLHALSKTKTLSALLGDKKIWGPDIYPLIGVIERRDEKQMTRQLIDFPPLLVLRDHFDRKLQDGDIVHLFSRAQIAALGDTEEPAGKLTPVAMGATDEDMTQDDSDAVTAPAIADFLRERAAFARGAVRDPGPWPVSAGITLENIIAVAGGLTLEASTENIELTSKWQGESTQGGGRSGTHRIAVNYSADDPAAIMVGPGDSVRIKQKFKRVEDSSVLIIGEVANPGRYDLMAGDRLSDLLARAGGVSAQAYPDGAIFSRDSERRAEEARFRAQAQDLEMKLAAAMAKKDEPDTTQISSVQELVTQLKQAEAVGRITVEADPGALAADPELDILLEPGDRIYIPKRPLTVRVAGEILSPASLQFRKDRNARDYIMQAGGYSWHADKDRVFVVYPDGSAQPLAVNSWNHSPVFVPPGSTIIVPRDPKPFDFIETARDISQILSNLAITGIFIDDIRSD